jgi:hypothetical protein
MNIIWEAIPLVTLAGTTLFCAWKWIETGKLALTLDGQVKRSISNFNMLSSKVEPLLDRAIDAEDRLRRIERQRHTAAKAARSAQLQQHRSKIAQTKAEIDRELGL